MSAHPNVLSLHGGGIRGVIPAVVLAEIERRTDRPASALFELIAGTSTGGILALALAKPDADGRPEYSAADLVELYAKDGHRIFSRSFWHQVRALGNLVDEKYPSGPIDEVLAEYFGDVRLKDALTELLIPSYEIETRDPWFFRRRSAREKPEQYDFFMREVARATSAAPTYFEPAKLPGDAEKPYWALVDGGVFANNPTMCALVDVLATDRDASPVCVSLGTGRLTRPLSYREAVGWGLVQWARPVIDVVFDGVADTVDYQARQLCRATEDTPEAYYLFQTELTTANDDMDDASPENIESLRALGEQIVRRESARLDELCERLLADGADYAATSSPSSGAVSSGS